MRLWVWATVGLIGCGGLELYEPVDPVVTDGAVAPGDAMLALEVVEPWFGTTLGADVTLTGTGFDPGVEVRFGGEEALVISATDDTIVVRAPETPAEGWVDVEVEGTNGATSLEEGFRYFEDATGEVGLQGTVAYAHYVGDYWGEPSPNDFAFASLRLIEPIAYEPWQLYSDTLGGCASNYDWSPETDAVETGSSELVVTGDGGSLALGQADDWYEVDGNAASSIVPGASYDLGPLGGAEDVPLFSLDGFVAVPAPFELSGPNLDTMTGVDRSVQFTWDDTDAGDWIALVLDKTHWDGTTWVTDQIVTCAFEDRGSFTVPGTIWEGWRSDDVIYVSIARVRDGSGTLPHNNASNAVTGAFWIVGAVRTN